MLAYTSARREAGSLITRSGIVSFMGGGHKAA